MENTTDIENILKHYLEPTIKQLTFGYEIKPPNLYYLVGRCKFPSQTLDVNTIDSIADRIKRIMKIVMLEEDIKSTNPDPYGKPKKYDDMMGDFQIQLYNMLAHVIGSEEITRIYPKNYLNKILQVDDSSPVNYSALLQVSSYIFLSERNGITFLELTLLSALALSCDRMENPQNMDKEKFKKHSLRLFKKAKIGFSSPSLYEALVEYFVGTFESLIIPDYDRVRIPFIRKYLLSAKYQNRKNADTALKTFRDRIEDGKEYDDTDMTDPDDYFFIQSEILQEHTFLLRCIIIAELLTKGIELGKNKNEEIIFASSEISSKMGLSDNELQNITISNFELSFSTRLAEIIKIYVDNSIMMAKEMMLSLSEACVVTTNTVQEFFEII